MRATLATIVIVCFLALASSQNCNEKIEGLSSCITEFATATTNDEAFCKNVETLCLH